MAYLSFALLEWIFLGPSVKPTITAPSILFSTFFSICPKYWNFHFLATLIHYLLSPLLHHHHLPLLITNWSFHSAAPYIWNQLPVSFRQSCGNQSPSHWPHFTRASSRSLLSLLPPTTRIFHSRLRLKFLRTLDCILDSYAHLFVLFTFVNISFSFWFHVVD